MKSTTLILGYKTQCYHCGAPIQMILLPTVGDRWQPAEPIENGDTSVVTLHSCPQNPRSLDYVAPEACRE